MSSNFKPEDFSVTVSPVAYFRSPFPSKFGVPRQSGVVRNLPGEVVFVPEFRRQEALKGLDGFDYLWLIWGFSGNAGSWKMTVRPPRLGGNRAVGVFASRSPFRPNGLGLSSVRISSVELDVPDGPVIKVLGADLMDGTPIYDIKPYVRYTDSHPEAVSGFTDEQEWNEAEVVFPERLREMFVRIAGPDRPDLAVETLVGTLAQRPVPQYQHDEGKIYGMPFMGCDVRFRVASGIVEVVDIVRS